MSNGNWRHCCSTDTHSTNHKQNRLDQDCELQNDAAKWSAVKSAWGQWVEAMEGAVSESNDCSTAQNKGTANWATTSRQTMSCMSLGATNGESIVQTPSTKAVVSIARSEVADTSCGNNGGKVSTWRAQSTAHLAHQGPHHWLGREIVRCAGARSTMLTRSKLMCASDVPLSVAP